MSRSSSGGSSRSSDGARVAVPRSGNESSVDSRRPRSSSRGHRRGGGSHGGGWWYDPWYYGYGPRWSWGWGWAGWWLPPVFYDDPYYGGRHRGRDYGYGAIDLDIQPESAEVYVDGELVGTCDDYDGFPSYLWLPRGAHDVVVYKSGYRTLSRQISVYPGQIFGFNERMERGDAIRPQDLPDRSTSRRDERLRRNREREEAVRERQERWREERGDDWEDRDDDRDREGDRWDDDEDDDEEVRPAPGARGADGGGDSSRLRLRVTPSDASVYLDGTFVGTAGQVSGSNGMLLPPGNHRLEVVRPGYQPEHRDFDSDPGQELELRIDLDED